MKKSITLKLFFITSMFLIIFTSITFLFQSMSFQKFYVSKKMSNLQSNVKKLKFYYMKSNSQADLLDFMWKFEDNNNAKVVIFNKSGTYIYVSDYMNPQNDQSKVTVMNRVIHDWMSSPDSLNSLKKNNAPATYIFDSPNFNIKNVVCVYPILNGGNIEDIIFAVSSLQPINEAASVIKELYIYIFSAALIVIFIMSLIYSNMISKPLVKMNKTAIKMASLDFSTKCEVKSKDEIGSLAVSLNSLSGNLHRALSDLRSSNKKLKLDIKKEKQVEKMRKEFVADVSHELKTPISIIKGYAEGLKDNIAEGEDRDFYIDVIIDEAGRMGNLVCDMLDLAQLESGTFKLNTENFFIDELILSIVKKFSNMTDESRIKINIKMEENVEVAGDRFRIEQVITNFLTNAIKHTPVDGTITIALSSNNNEVLVQIENEGNPIDPSEIQNIWSKFYKIDKSRKRGEEGTGLGLTIAKNILMLHKSKFGVKNTDTGVNFYFTLKLA